MEVGSLILPQAKVAWKAVCNLHSVRIVNELERCAEWMLQKTNSPSLARGGKSETALALISWRDTLHDTTDGRSD